MNKKSLVAIGAVVIVAAAAVAALRFATPEDNWLCQNGLWVKHGNPSQAMPQEGCGTVQQTSADQQLVGNDRDEHGCIGSAGFSWCEPKNKCLRVWEEACYSGPEQEIQYLLAKKYNRPIAEITVKATKQTENYILGSVKFSMPGNPSEVGEGGVVLAAKENNVWNVAYDGNGIVPCQEIKRQYDFPADFLPNLCN